MSVRSEVIRIINELLSTGKKISELPAGSSPSGAELIEAVQGGVSVSLTVSQVATGGAGVLSVVAGTNVTVDNTDPQNPIVSATGSGVGGVQSVTGDGVDNSDPDNPVLSFPTPSDIGLGNVNNVATVGVQDLFVSASAMWPRVTSGCSVLTKSEIATSLFNIQSLDFDQTTQEFCQFQITLPRKWNNGTVTAVFYWTATAGSGDVQWGISGGAYSNDDALTVALGTAQTVDDTLIATNDLHITSATSAITLAGTPADADFLAFQISRNPGSDTLSGDAKLLGVSIRVTTDSAIDG